MLVTERRIQLTAALWPAAPACNCVARLICMLLRTAGNVKCHAEEMVDLHQMFRPCLRQVRQLQQKQPSALCKLCRYSPETEAP